MYNATVEDEQTKIVEKTLWVKFIIAFGDYLVKYNETHTMSFLQNNAVALFHPEVETYPKEWYPCSRCKGSWACGVL